MPTKTAPKREDNIDQQQHERFDPQKRQQHAKALKDRENGGERSPQEYDDDFKGIADRLEQDPDFNRGDADEKEQRGDANWDTNYTQSNRQVMGFKQLIRRYGPISGVGIGLSAIMMTLMTTSAPVALLNNIKEVAVGNWDMQSISAEVRSRRLVNSRLTGEATNGVCARVALACKYSKPSNKMLNDLDKAGIKAINADGTVIEKQRLLNGERPAFYETPEGTRVTPANFQAELQHNPEFRAAFRRAYNPRWINWSDDVAARFFGMFKIKKVNPAQIRDADGPEDARKAVHNIADGGNQGGGDPNARRTAIEGQVRQESQKWSAKTARSIAKAGSGPELSILAFCSLLRIPGLVSNVIRAYRFAQAIAVAHYIYTAADKIKSREGDDKETRNVASLLTDTFVDPATGRAGKSALDAGGMKYALFGDVGSAKGSANTQRLIPGAAAGGFSKMARITDNKNLRGACNVASNDALWTAIGTIQTIVRPTPVGVILTVVDIGVLVLSSTGKLDNLIQWVINNALNIINEAVDWAAVADAAFGDYVKGAVGEELGDIVGSAMPQGMAIMANIGGNIPLSPKQAVEFQQRVQQPLLAQWAEEDRLTHSPFDASNPNTFLGSITTQLMPYMSRMSSVSGVLSSFANFSSTSLSSMLSPSKANALLKNEDDANSCTADYAIASSAAAAGPVCNVFYGVPVGHMGLDPLRVLDLLFSLKEIDSQGEIVPDSNLDNWKKDCHTADMMSLNDCMSNPALGEGQAFAAALYSLYLIDKRAIEGMDDEHPGRIEGGGVAADANPPGSTGQVVGDMAWPVDSKLWGTNRAGFLKGHNGGGNFTGGMSQSSVDLGRDAGLSEGMPVYAMLGGKVVQAPLGRSGTQCAGNPNGSDNGGLMIESNYQGGVVRISYAHGKNVRFQTGQTMETGQQIMDVGNVGNSCSPHVHIDMTYNGRTVCPQDVFLALGAGQQPNLQELTGKATNGCFGRG